MRWFFLSCSLGVHSLQVYPDVVNPVDKERREQRAARMMELIKIGAPHLEAAGIDTGASTHTPENVTYSTSTAGIDTGVCTHTPENEEDGPVDEAQREKADSLVRRMTVLMHLAVLWLCIAYHLRWVF